MRVNHLRDRILMETETSKQTIGRHGWIRTCMGRNYKTQQDASCCLQPQRERAMCMLMNGLHILWFLSCMTISPKKTVFCNRMVLGHIQLESHSSLLQITTSAYCIGLHCHQTCPQLNMFGMNLREGFMSGHTHL